jgi:hypothetical protein
MRRIIARVFQTLCVAALLLAAAQSQPSVAQTTNTNSAQTAAPAPDQRQWLSITVVSVKPEMMTEFRNFVKTETNPALRKGGAMWRDVWQTTAAAGDAFEYVIVAPIDNFAQYDGPGPLEKGLGKEGLAAWQAKASRYVNSVRRFVIRTRPDLSYEGKRTGPPKLAVVSHLHVAPGRGQDFENYTKNDFLPVVKQGQVTYRVAETIFGGDANEFITLTLRESFADIDKGPVAVQVLGAEGAAKLFQKLTTGTLVHVERSFARYVPELSIMPGETAK